MSIKDQEEVKEILNPKVGERIRCCPFCFAGPRDIEITLASCKQREPEAFYYVYCQKCAARGPDADDYAECLDRWNARFGA